MRYEVLGSEIVFRGKVFNVRLDQIRLPDGRTGRMDILEHAQAVTILPVDSDSRIWFIRQYRHPAVEDILELPAGVMEPGELPAESAQRELREEIGMAAGKLDALGEFYLAPGYSSEYMYVFLATELYSAALKPDEDEAIEIVKVSTQEALSMAAQGRVKDAKSLAALLLWSLRKKD
ncbi:MAG: NUDIX hydrolase [Anaerolineales bacterium]|nr:NUDIX hydrolase [Anaerolineales bacterium]